MRDSCTKKGLGVTRFRTYPLGRRNLLRGTPRYPAEEGSTREEKNQKTSEVSACVPREQLSK